MVFLVLLAVLRFTFVRSEEKSAGFCVRVRRSSSHREGHFSILNDRDSVTTDSIHLDAIRRRLFHRLLIFRGRVTLYCLKTTGAEIQPMGIGRPYRRR